jgi:hypothetical protein
MEYGKDELLELRQTTQELADIFFDVVHSGGHTKIETREGRHTRNDVLEVTLKLRLEYCREREREPDCKMLDTVMHKED